MLDFFPRRARRPVSDLSVVPILDMFVCVIFFLLLGTSFMQFTKLSLPPSAVSTSTDPVAAPPLSARLIGTVQGERLSLVLTWLGSEPGKLTQEFAVNGAGTETERRALLKQVAALVGEFSKKYPTEKVIRIGLGSDVSYQHLVTIMDGVKNSMPDMVLVSYNEAQASIESPKTNGGQ